jgi:hypothetical protein
VTIALFVDDHHVRAAAGVRRVFHRFEKHDAELFAIRNETN